MSSNKEVAIIEPPPKKLKQARLPFQVLPTKPVNSGTRTSASLASPSVTKKRKLSDSAPGPSKATKTKCVDKELSPRVRDETENEVSSSSEADPAFVKSSILCDENIKPDKSKGIGLLDKFVRTTPTQKPEISTSSESVIDLSSDSSNEAQAVEDLKTSPKITDDHVNKSNELKDDRIEHKGEDEDPSNEDIPEAKCADPNDSVCASSVLDNLSESALSEIDLDSSVASIDTSLDTPKTKIPLGAPRKEDRSKRQEEKDRLKVERQKQKEAEKTERARLKQVEKEKKEKERLEQKQKREKEKQEKLEQLQREKEEKQRQRDDEKRKKEEEERKKKQEIIDAKNREKKRKEEEKQKEEDELRKKKEKEMKIFNKFFTKTEKQPAEAGAPVSKTGPFFPFEVKKDMKLAPTQRVPLHLLSKRSSTLDTLMEPQIADKLYVSELKSGETTPGRDVQTWPLELDVEVVSSPSKGPLGGKKEKRMRAKLLQFHENYRPAYYGTWRKNSRALSARNPFRKDKVLFDYEVESDDEWEEEEPGESLSHSEGEDSDGEAPAEDGDEEDGFFVPHGYLSEGEGCESEEEDNSPEKLKARQLAKAKAFESEMKNKCEVLRPICIGCCWWGSENTNSDPNLNALAAFSVVTFDPTPILLTKPDKVMKESPGDCTGADKETKSLPQLKPVPQEAMADLMTLVHGNSAGSKKLLREFREFWRMKNSGNNAKVACTEKPSIEDSDEDPLTPAKSQPAAAEVEESPHTISKRQLHYTIRDIAVYERRDLHPVKCWYVKDELLAGNGLSALPVPTQWKWITKNSPRKRVVTPKVVTPSPVVDVEKGMASPGGPTMKQFTVAKASPNFAGPNAIKEPIVEVAQKPASVPPATPPAPSVKQFLVPRASPNFASPSVEKSTPKVAITPQTDKVTSVVTTTPVTGSKRQGRPKRQTPTSRMRAGALFKSPTGTPILSDRPASAPRSPQASPSTSSPLAPRPVSSSTSPTSPGLPFQAVPGCSQDNPMEID